MTQDHTSNLWGLFLKNCSFSPRFTCFLSSDRMRNGYAVTGFSVTSSAGQSTMADQNCEENWNLSSKLRSGFKNKQFCRTSLGHSYPCKHGPSCVLKEKTRFQL